MTAPAPEPKAPKIRAPHTPSLEPRAPHAPSPEPRAPHTPAPHGAAPQTPAPQTPAAPTPAPDADQASPSSSNGKIGEIWCLEARRQISPIFRGWRSRGKNRPARRGWGAGWGAVLVAAGFAAWAGTQYDAASSSSGPVSSPGQVRDAALAAGTRELADLNSVSATNIPAAEKRWLADTTGAEHTKIAATNSAAAAQIAKVKTSSAGTVTAAALTAFSAPAAGGTTSRSGARSSAPAGTATMIATVSVAQTNASHVTNTVANRYRVTLTLTSAGWKISSLMGS